MNYLTHEEIIEDFKKCIVLEWSKDDLKTFTETQFDQLCAYHNNLGIQIRNYYKLWEIPWEPEMKEYHGCICDCSSYHPYAVSNTIIQEVWKRFQNEQ
jgi:aldehyde:ferredoxin oxidoreductase